MCCCGNVSVWNAGGHIKGKMKAKAYLSLIVCVWNAHATHTMQRSISWGLGYTYHRCDLLTQTLAFFIPWNLFHTNTYIDNTYLVQLCRGDDFVHALQTTTSPTENSHLNIENGKKVGKLFLVRHTYVHTIHQGSFGNYFTHHAQQTRKKVCQWEKEKIG